MSGAPRTHYEGDAAFRNTLARLQRSRNVGDIELSHITGIPSATIWKMKSGKPPRLVTAGEAKVIADAFDMTVDEFFVVQPEEHTKENNDVR